MRNLILLILIFFFYLKPNCQFYYTGTDKAFQKLYQIETEHFTVVFPHGYKFEGNKLANFLEQVYILASQTMESKLKKKMPVLLHTDYAISNGFVAWAPRRTEIYNTPPQDSYSQDWLMQVAIHEGRHIVQLNHIENGVNNIFKILFGEGVTGILSGMFPLWAYEGDAVVAETALTNTGRGRSPSFLMGIKAISIEKEKPYSYEKAYFGSYKDFVPDYYSYGYLMSSTARMKYDSLFWQNVLSDIPSGSFRLYPTYFSMKKRYNLSKHGLYYNSINLYKNYWQDEIYNTTDYPSYNKKTKKEFTSYRYPVVTEKNTIICEKSCKSYINKLVEIETSGKEKTLHIPGFNISGKLSYASSKLAWTEIVNNPRWELSQNAIIKVLDIHTGKTKTLGKKSKYFSPSLNPSGDKIVAVETGNSRFDYLVIFDVNTGEILKKIAIDDGKIQRPSWHPAGNKIVYTRISSSGKYIEILNTDNEKVETVYGPDNEDISSPVFYKNYILFSASFNQVDNIYAIDIQTKNRFIITHSKYGAFDPQIRANNSILYFSEYSSQGYNVSFLHFSNKFFEKEYDKKKSDPEIIKHIAEQENQKFISTTGNLKNYEISDYKKWKHLVNFHTWLPFYTNTITGEFSEPRIYPGAMLFTQNLTGTLYGWTAYSYRNGFHYANANLTYAGMLPVFELNYQFGGLPYLEQGSFTLNHELKPDNQNISLSSYIPLFFNHGPVRLSIQPRIDMLYDDTYTYNSSKSAFEIGFTEFHYGGYIFLYSGMAERDIYPRFGLYTKYKFITTPFEDNYGTMSQFTIRSFLPGILKNNSLRLTLYYQMQYTNSSEFRYSSSLDFPRGYNTYISNELKMFSADYTFPVIYPDLRCGNFLYLKRIRANMFYDQSFVKGILTRTQTGLSYKNFTFNSLGIELLFDSHFAHIIFPLSAGIRLSYKPQYAETIFSYILSYSLSNF